MNSGLDLYPLRLNNNLAVHIMYCEPPPSIIYIKFSHFNETKVESFS